jgi:hypothetical protein
MTIDSKHEIVRLIKAEKQRHGSYNRLSRVCKVSNATISNMVNSNWQSVSNELWEIVGKALNYNENTWAIAKTFNLRQMHQVLNTARETSSFWAVSCKAGSGKTAAIKYYANTNIKGVYLLQAEEWTQRQFISALCDTLGIQPVSGYNSVSMMLQQVVSYFTRRRTDKPLLIIDEADKLKDSAKRMLIPLFNRLEDILACVIAGTENLEAEIKKGVRARRKGFDEIDSRFGRTYLRLTGASAQDVSAICRSNGISHEETIRKIWKESNPGVTEVGGSSIRVVEDLRRIKRLIVAEKCLNMFNENAPV